MDEVGATKLLLSQGGWVCAQVPQQQFLRPAAEIDSYFVSAGPEPQSIREAYSPTSPVVGQLSPGQLVHGRLLCTSDQPVERVQLDSGHWASVKVADRTLLHAACPADRPYMGVSSKGVPIRAGFLERSAVSGEVRYGEVVHGVFECPGPSGSLRLLLDSGGWTLVHGGNAAQPSLVQAELLDEHYLCCAGPGEAICCQRSFCASSPKVGSLRHGGVCRATLSCSSQSGARRLGLDDGTWVTAEDRLRPLSLAAATYLCVGPQGTLVSSGFGHGAEEVGRLAAGQVVRGAAECVAVDGSVHVLLEEGEQHGGMWALRESVDAGGPPRTLMREASVVDERLVCVSAKPVRVDRSFSTASPPAGEIHVGQMVRAVLTCENAKGDTRVKLASGQWTSLRRHGAGDPQLFQAAADDTL